MGNKMWHMYIMEYYSDLEIYEIQIYATTRMNPENMLSNWIQSKILHTGAGEVAQQLQTHTIIGEDLWIWFPEPRKDG